MSPLVTKQRKFVRLLVELLSWALAQGYHIRLGEAWRSPEQAARNAARGVGIANSLHCERLAIDLLISDGTRELITVDEVRPLGEYWKSLDPDARWGGDFVGRTAGDVGHFSLSHLGRA